MGHTYQDQYFDKWIRQNFLVPHCIVLEIKASNSCFATLKIYSVEFNTYTISCWAYVYDHLLSLIYSLGLVRIPNVECSLGTYTQSKRELDELCTWNRMKTLLIGT